MTKVYWVKGHTEKDEKLADCHEKENTRVDEDAEAAYKHQNTPEYTWGGVRPPTGLSVRSSNRQKRSWWTRWEPQCCGTSKWSSISGAGRPGRERAHGLNGRATPTLKGTPVRVGERKRQTP